MGCLTDRSVKTVGEGRHGDGDGLQLIVSASGRRKWVLRYQVNGVRRDMGLGPYPAIGLSDARIAAADARKLIARGVDPLDDRKASRKAERPVPTFGDIAKTVIADAQSKSNNAKVRYQWERHLGPAYSGTLLARPVHEITTVDVAAVLRPVWRTKPEVARKLYPAIRRVFEHARVLLRDEHGIVMPDNPARWADLKAMGFETPTKLTKGSHPSLPYNQMAAFMADLRARDAVAARALEFLILTNVRTDAVLKAAWDEFDLDQALWTVPLANLKDRKHRKEGFRAPLVARAVEIVEQMHLGRVSRFVFPGQARGKPLSNMALLTLLKRMNSGAEKNWIDPASGRRVTAHGFRATFRTWAEEAATFPHAVIEQAMGPQVGSQVERAYRRTDVLDRRRQLMDTWAQWCEPNAEDTTRCPCDPQGAAGGEPMNADSEHKPSGDGPTAARDDVAPARARGKQLRARLARALLSAQMSKSIPAAVAREILATEEKLCPINSAVEMRDKSIDDILTLSLDARNVGYFDKGKTLDVVGAYLAAHKILTEMLIRLRASPRDLELAQAALSVVTSIGIAVGSVSPKLASEFQRVVMQTRIANARAKAAARKLTRSCVDQTIIACFEDQSLPRGLKANSQRAARVLDVVNNRLSALAADSSVTPTRYSTADSLRRRFEQAKRRTAN